MEELQERVQIIDVGKFAVGPLRSPAAPGIVADGLVASGERLELVVPNASIQQTIVEQHDRWLLLARDLKVQPGTVDRGRSGEHGPTLRERNVDSHHYYRQNDTYDHQLSQGLAPL